MGLIEAINFSYIKESVVNRVKDPFPCASN